MGPTDKEDEGDDEARGGRHKRKRHDADEAPPAQTVPADVEPTAKRAKGAQSDADHEAQGKAKKYGKIS